MTKTFMLLVHADADGWDDLDDAAAAAAIEERANAIEALRSSGHLIACSPFTHPSSAREVRVRRGRTEVSKPQPTDAPIAGFYLVEADDLDDAERLATSIPDAASAHVTVRELMPLPGLPREVPSPIRKPI